LTSAARAALNVLPPSREGVPRARVIFDGRPTALDVDAETIAAHLLSNHVTSAMPRFSPHWLSVTPPR